MSALPAPALTSHAPRSGAAAQLSTPARRRSSAIPIAVGRLGSAGACSTTASWRGAGPTRFTDGERIWVGVGGERSASAVVYVNELLHVGVQTWVGDEAVLEVAQFVAELADQYEIVEAVYDPWRAGQMAQEWEQRGIRAVAFAQSDAKDDPRLRTPL